MIVGIRRDVARFSQLSGLMFQFNLDSETWAQMKLPQRQRLQSASDVRRGGYVPPERAFHSAHIMGNYMLVFGGYSHKHKEVEKCYDENIYFFHLGCHTWVSQRILEHSPQGRAYPKNQGNCRESATKYLSSACTFVDFSEIHYYLRLQ